MQGETASRGKNGLGKGRGATTFSKFGVQFLGIGYYTEQNMDGIPSFVHCSLFRNGNHIFIYSLTHSIRVRRRCGLCEITLTTSFIGRQR